MYDSLISKIKKKYNEYFDLRKKEEKIIEKNEINKLKDIYKNEKISDMFFTILKFNENKIKKEENVVYSTFKYLVENKININVIYEQFPIFLEEYLKNEIENNKLSNLEEKNFKYF